MLHKWVIYLVRSSRKNYKVHWWTVKDGWDYQQPQPHPQNRKQLHVEISISAACSNKYWAMCICSFFPLVLVTRIYQINWIIVPISINVPRLISDLKDLPHVGTVCWKLNFEILRMPYHITQLILHVTVLLERSKESDKQQVFSGNSTSPIVLCPNFGKHFK